MGKRSEGRIDKVAVFHAFVGMLRPDLVKPLIDAQTRRVTRTFMRRVRKLYSVQEAILFGGRARGVYTDESDVDIAVLLHGAKGNRTAAALDMADIAFESCSIQAFS
jgi:hypothetical protein